MLELHLLGRFDLRLDHAPLEIPSRPAQSLLAYLVLNKGAAHRREKLAGLFWPDSDEARARRNLRQALWLIRKAIEPSGSQPTGSQPNGPAFLLADDITIAFNAASDHWLDVDVFARKGDEDDPQVLSESLTLYAGELLPGFYDEWAVLERERLQAVFERKIRQLLDRLVAAHRWDDGLEWGERWLAAGGAPEPAYRALMIAHAERGDLSQMAAVYQRCVDALERELGVEPSPQTRALYERLSKGEKEIPGTTPIDARIEARFRLTGELGRGGLGVVYSAHDTLLDRAVAVKVLSPGALGTEGRARMLREAQSVARLNHTNIVAVYDAGEAPLPGQAGIVPYIVMELVEGQSLHQKRPTSVDEVVQIAIQICLALEHAHAHGVIHRDLKPENILITPDGKVKLTDFGLAHFIHASRLTEEGTFIGTPYYVAPEIIRGETIDARSDLYSLGIVLYELAAGRLPFTGDNLTAIVSQHLHATVTPPSTHNPAILPALDTLILQLMSKQPADRPSTAAVVHAALEELAGVPSISDTQPAPGEPPYKGLQQFNEADAALFFGRETLTEKLLLRLLPSRREGRPAENILAVVGASGSGKSSVVRAGLIPALRRNLPQSLICLITPTARPLESLAASLTHQAESVFATTTLIDDLARDPRSLHLFARRLCQEERAERLFLVVDQFEELFTLCRSEAEREAFVNNLLTAAWPDGITTVILVLRADFYAHCAQYAELRDALARHQEYIGPMNAEELCQAIEEPARQENWQLEEGLADLLLKDVLGEPGGLPLLSHALLETWARRRGRSLTLAGYAQTGGVRGAIARTAERVYQDFAPEEQRTCRNVFLRLTEPGVRAEGDDLPALDTRRRATLAELIPHPEDAPLVETVVQTLADARLITTTAGSVEVAHEALIREWPTLRQWLEEDREGLRLHRHLTEAAQSWAAIDREEGELYRGARLAQANEWAIAHPQTLNVLEREFLTVSQALAEHEARERESQQKRELEAAQKLAETERQRAEDQSRAALRLRQRALFLAGAVALASILAVVAIIVGLQARAQARIAFARELAAASESNLTVDPERSVLLALEAIAITYEQDGTVIREAETALHRALPSLRALLTLPGHEARTSGIDLSPDGTLLATSSADGTVKLWQIALDYEGERVLRTLTGHEDWVFTVHFSPDGTRLASASADGTARVWETATGQELLTLPGHEFGAGDAAFSPDGRHLATGDGNGVVFVWDLTAPPAQGDPVPLFTLTGPAGVNALAFSPNSQWLASGSGEGVISVWGLDSAGVPVSDEPGWSLCCHNGGVGVVVFSPDSQRLATSGNDNLAQVWDVQTGKKMITIYAHGGPVDGLAFDASGTRLATGSGDGTARVWEIPPGATGAREQVTIYVNNLIGVAFTPDGERLVTGSESGSLTVWDLSPGREWLTLAGHTDWVFDVAFSPTENLLATASNDGTVKIWDSETGEERLTLTGHAAQVWHLAFSPDGTKLVTTSSDATAKVWEVKTGRELFTLTGHVNTPEAFPYSGVGPVVFSFDGRWIATGGGDHTARLWDAATGEQIRVFSGHTLDVNGVALSPDGARLVTVSFDSAVKIWEVATGNILATITLPGEEYGLWAFALSPDGTGVHETRLAVSQHDGSVSVWDVSENSLEQPLYTLAGHTSIVTGLAFSPDGARLATASFDGTTKIWEVSTGAELLTLSGHAGNVIGVAFSPDERLATSSGDGTARVYILPIEDLIALAYSRLTRGLTEQECQQFLHLMQCP